MCEEKLLDEIIQRLGMEVKGLYAKVAEGPVSAATVETLVRERLGHFGAQVTGVLLQALDRRLTADRPIHDHRTRTVVTLFGPVDVTRSRCPDGTYPLDDALGLMGRHAWTAGVQEAVSLVSCECSFETTGDRLESLLGLSIRAPSVKALAEEAGRRATPLVADTPPTADGAAGQTLIVATDGCQAPQRDGWHEVKVAHALYARNPLSHGRGTREGFVEGIPRLAFGRRGIRPRVVAAGLRLGGGACAAGRGDGRRGAVDLEPGGGALSRRGGDRGFLPRGGAPVDGGGGGVGGPGAVGSDAGLGASLSASAERGTGGPRHRRCGACPGASGFAPVGGGGGRGASERGLLPDESRADAL